MIETRIYLTYIYISVLYMYISYLIKGYRQVSEVHAPCECLTDEARPVLG